MSLCLLTLPVSRGCGSSSGIISSISIILAILVAIVLAFEVEVAIKILSDSISCIVLLVLSQVSNDNNKIEKNTSTNITNDNNK